MNPIAAQKVIIQAMDDTKCEPLFTDEPNTRAMYGLARLQVPEKFGDTWQQRASDWRAAYNNRPKT